MMLGRRWTVRIKVRNVTKQWIEEREVIADLRDDAIAIAASESSRDVVGCARAERTDPTIDDGED